MKHAIFQIKLDVTICAYALIHIAHLQLRTRNELITLPRFIIYQQWRTVNSKRKGPRTGTHAKH